jgi:hypothetical protein
MMGEGRLEEESCRLTSILRALVRPEEQVLVLLGAGGGLLWGLLSLVVGLSEPLVPASGPLHLAISIINLPLSLGWWLGSTVQPPFVDPSGLVMVTGAVLGIFPVMVWLGIDRWQHR